MADRLAVAGEPRRAVGQVALVLLLADRQAQVRLRAAAVHALAALGGEQRHHAVAGRHGRHALADLLDHAAALVPEDGGRVAGGVGAGRRVEVGVADAAGQQPHEHLAGAGRRPARPPAPPGASPKLSSTAARIRMARPYDARAMAALEDLARDPDARQEQIVAVLVDAFEELIEADPRAFRRKFRKMAADPFAFYRGSACLFYADVAELEDRWADERTGRVWIQGDLHAENYGTYMDSSGVLVFDVNDFDEAYLGHFTWDLRRMAASLALLGFAKAISDETIAEMIAGYAARLRRAGARVRHRRPRRRVPADAGATPRASCTTCCCAARLETRVQLLERADRDRGRRAAVPRRARRAAAGGRRARRGARGLRRLPRHDPRAQAPAQRLLRRQGHRRAQPASGSAAPACPPTTCSSRAAARRSRTTSCSR